MKIFIKILLFIVTATSLSIGGTLILSPIFISFFRWFVETSGELLPLILIAIGIIGMYILSKIKF